MKNCCECRLDLPLTMYHTNKTHKDGHSAMCKPCTKVYKKAYYERNKAAVKDKSKELYSGQGRLRYLVNKSRDRAKLQGLEHTITVDDLVLPDACPYLGITLTTEWGKGQLKTNASIDRIDSTKGYIPGNVQIISRLANTMKSDATEEQLMRFAQAIQALHGTPSHKHPEE